MSWEVFPFLHYFRTVCIEMVSFSLEWFMDITREDIGTYSVIFVNRLLTAAWISLIDIGQFVSSKKFFHLIIEFIGIQFFKIVLVIFLISHEIYRNTTILVPDRDDVHHLTCYSRLVWGEGGQFY